MKPILIFVHHTYEDLELWYTKMRLEEAGYKTVVAGPEAKKVYQSKHGYPCTSDVSWKDIHSKDFQGLCIPGGYAPDLMRTEPKVLELTKSFHNENKMIAFICHAGWVPVSANIVKGKKVTSVDSIKDDLENAGAIWKNEPFVVDGNLVSGRVVADIPHFAKAVIKHLGG